MRTLTIALLLCPMLLAAATARAAEQMKPGLWEMTMKSDEMAKMPPMSPEQIEQMRKMGITMPQVQDGGMVTKVCISKQMAERDQAPGMSQDASGCQSKNYRRSGNTYSVDIVCTGPTMKGEGKARGTYAGTNAFTSTYDFKGTVNGQPVTQHHEGSGTWLSADCGNVKPIGDVPPKR
ncbi:MAG: DUF3617 domain-containing protein [Candidatus Rokuibacteriota bacterium]